MIKHSESSQQAILEALVSASPVAILTLDLDMNVTMWNPASERIFGWTADEVLGKPYPLVPPEEWDRFEGFYRTVISGEGFTGVEAVRTRKDGSEVWTAISTAPILGSRGEVVGAMALLEDISERKRLEEQYRQAAKLEALGRLAGGVAHDFNNLLTVILAYGETLSAHAQDDQIAESATAIRHAAQRAADLTRQLLAFSRQQVLQSQVLDLNESVRATKEILRRLIGEHITIELSLLDKPVWVRIDPTQLEQLLMNLAANARDAMPDGGTLALSTTRVIRRGEPWVQLAVSDDGLGMDEETASRVFEPFFTTKPLHRGTGLGMASVYGIVHQTGGDVDVETKVGGGTTFRVLLPQAEPGEPMLHVEHTRDTERDGLCILIAEDDRDVREVLKSMLEACGHHVLAAADGVDALETARTYEGRIDLLITDVVMPRMGGGELARNLSRARNDTAVLYVSGYADDDVVRQGVERGGHFLQKPYSLRALRDALSRALDR